MKVSKFELFKEKTEYGFMPTLTAYILDGNPKDYELRPAIIVIPGGGYDHIAFREGERIALSYSAAGFHTFILDYCIAPHRHPLPILCAAKAIEMIRNKSVEWSVDPNNIAVCGFSAGGHLAASISTMWNDNTIFTSDINKNRIYRPDATILCYPVITSGEYANKGSFENLTGSKMKDELWDYYSIEDRVDENTPSAFLWHTFSDNCVLVENSLLYANALRRKNIPFELHIYPDGGHGMSLVSDETYWSVSKFSRKYPWMQQSIEWLNLQFGITKIEK